MEIKILKEDGYELALRGMAYSFKDRSEPVDAWFDRVKERAEKRAPLLAPKGGGHNKFLESMVVWIDVEAPRSFWSEFDTYRVGTTKQSESTMHTLSKRPPTHEDFEEGTTQMTINSFILQWQELKDDITKLKENLPEGYLQRRLVCTNYMMMRNIIKQRTNHRYRRWQKFIDEILIQVQYPEFLG